MTLTLDQRKLQNCQEELRQARDEIHRLKHQHVNDECANRMLIEEIERMRKLSICGCGDRFTEHDPGTCGNCVASGNSHLRAKIDALVYDDSAIPIHEQLAAIGESAPEGTFDRLNNLTAAGPHTIQVAA